ncbi:MAG: PaaI family thioesterase [Actinomycetota bacterium]
MTDHPMADAVPAGYERHFKQSGFTDPWEPLYSRATTTQVSIGTIAHEGHCNSRGLIHGAFLAAIADNAMGLSVGVARAEKGLPEASLVTTNLSIDYVGRASVGAWVYTDCEVIKAGRTLNVVTGVVRTADGPVARVNATFQAL